MWTAQILQELKAEIREEIADKTPTMLVSVMTKTRKQLTQWNGGGGSHILDLILKLSKQTLKCTYTIINNYKFLIHIMGFISFLNKQVLLPHSVSLF